MQTLSRDHDDLTGYGPVGSGPENDDGTSGDVDNHRDPHDHREKRDHAEIRPSSDPGSSS
jgi:hypothetical protein